MDSCAEFCHNWRMLHGARTQRGKRRIGEAAGAAGSVCMAGSGRRAGQARAPGYAVSVVGDVGRSHEVGFKLSRTDFG